MRMNASSTMDTGRVKIVAPTPKEGMSANVTPFQERWVIPFSSRDASPWRFKMLRRDVHHMNSFDNLILGQMYSKICTPIFWLFMKWDVNIAILELELVSIGNFTFYVFLNPFIFVKITVFSFYAVIVILQKILGNGYRIKTVI